MVEQVTIAAKHSKLESKAGVRRCKVGVKRCVTLAESRVERGCEARCEVSVKSKQSVNGVKLVRQCEPARLGCEAGVEQLCGL